jgi:hypothetical protein
MARKRDISPDKALQRVITALETSDTLNDPSHHDAIRSLVLGGPFVVNATYRAALARPHPEVSLWRAELVQYLRTLVQTHDHRQVMGTLLTNDQPGSGSLTTTGPFRFSATLVNGRVSSTVDSQSIRDVAILNLHYRLLEVGLRNIRRCADPKCRRLFVKTYRREFCSVTCQARRNKELNRARHAAHREQQLKRRRVARAALGAH